MPGPRSCPRCPPHPRLPAGPCPHATPTRPVPRLPPHTLRLCPRKPAVLPGMRCSVRPPRSVQTPTGRAGLRTRRPLVQVPYMHGPLLHQPTCRHIGPVEWVPEPACPTVLVNWSMLTNRGGPPCAPVWPAGRALLATMRVASLHGEGNCAGKGDSLGGVQHKRMGIRCQGAALRVERSGCCVGLRYACEQNQLAAEKGHAED